MGAGKDGWKGPFGNEGCNGVGALMRGAFVAAFGGGRTECAPTGDSTPTSRIPASGGSGITQPRVWGIPHRVAMRSGVSAAGARRAALRHAPLGKESGVTRFGVLALLGRLAM